MIMMEMIYFMIGKQSLNDKLIARLRRRRAIVLTKIYLCSLVLFSILFRGIYFPINRNVQLKKIFPFKWIKIGFLGLMIDIVKTPGYLLGSLYSIFRKK